MIIATMAITKTSFSICFVRLLIKPHSQFSFSSAACLFYHVSPWIIRHTQDYIKYPFFVKLLYYISWQKVLYSNYLYTSRQSKSPRSSDLINISAVAKLVAKGILCISHNLKILFTSGS